MKRLLALVIFIAANLIINPTSAQIVDRTKERAENKTNNRIDNRIDKGIDKGLDSIEGLFKKKNKKDKGESGSESSSDETQNGNEAGDMPNMAGMFGSGGDIEEKYSFQHKVHIEIKSSDKKGETYDQNMVMLSNDDSNIGAFEMTMAEAQESTVVFDFDNKQMITLVNASGMKMAVVVKMDPAAYEPTENENSDDEDAPEFKKTGRSKEILGYTCDEYVAEDDESTMEMWISQEVVVDLFKAFSAYGAQQKQATTPQAYPGLTGTMMEMNSTSKKHAKEKTTWKVTKIEKNSPSTISTAGYSVMGG
jgi:hypothetical protein